jgi:hypothetical protein
MSKIKVPETHPRDRFSIRSTGNRLIPEAMALSIALVACKQLMPQQPLLTPTKLGDDPTKATFHDVLFSCGPIQDPPFDRCARTFNA